MTTAYEIITDFSIFEKLRDDWNRLLAGHPLDHAFFRHEWFSCWFRHLGRPDRMCLVIGRRGPDIVALAPMIVAPEKFKRLPARVLSFASSGLTPRCNFVFADNESADGLFQFLLGIRGIDFIIARGMDTAAAPTTAYRTSLRAAGRPTIIETARRSPYLFTEGSWDSYVAGLPKQFRSNLKIAANRLAQAGEIETCKITGYSELNALLPDLVEISSRSWKAAEGTDLKSLPQVVRFLDDFSRLGEPDSLWELWVLFLDGRPIGFHYALRDPNRLSLIRTDFDMAYRDLSPGHNLQMAILRDLFDREGIWEYDMGGQAYDYKLRWTRLIREHIDIWTSGSRLWGRLLMFGKQRLLSRTPPRSDPTAGSTGER